MKIKLLFICIYLSIQLPVFSQNYFYEDFENGSGEGAVIELEGWNQIYENGTAWDWIFYDGGHSATPAVPDSRHPRHAYEGSLNALFFIQSSANVTTKLTTPLIDLATAYKPELKFWHAQDKWYHGGVYNCDVLKVYFKATEASEWQLMETYTDTIKDWIEQTIFIPIEYHNEDFTIAFEAIGKGGHGVAVDSVVVYETGVYPFHVEEIEILEVNHNEVPTGIIDLPVANINLVAAGNTGKTYLDSIAVKYTGSDENDIVSSSAKLYVTEDDFFSTASQVNGSVSLQNGNLIFDNLNYELDRGDNYFWVTLDINSNAVHDNLVSYQFDEGSIKAVIDTTGLPWSEDLYEVDGTLYIKLADGSWVNFPILSYYPESDFVPIEDFTLWESLYFTSFEQGNGWDFAGEFEISVPLGKGGSLGNTDPDYTISGSKILGTDITGLNDNSGDYEPLLTEDEYYAQTPTIPVKYYKDLHISFDRWLNLDFFDTAKVQMKIDTASEWQLIWQNPGKMNDSYWIAQKYRVADLDRKDSVKFRFTIGPTDEYGQYSGWNIDNFALIGNFIDKDVGVTEWVSPVTDCGLEEQSITVKVANFAGLPTPNEIPVAYSIDGGTSWVTETINQVIALEDTIEYTFSQLADFTATGDYSLMAKTLLEGDEDNSNDQADSSLLSIPNYSIPYSQDFETDEDFWYTVQETVLWEFGTPTKGKLNSAASGVNCWVTVKAINYPMDTYAELISPCFDFTQTSKAIFECKVLADFESKTDGVALYYTLDGGDNWTLINNNDGFGEYWNWYTDSISATLGTEAFCFEMGGWTRTRHVLPAEINGKNRVNFKFVFQSDALGYSREGMAIDDIKIYEAPNDVSIVSVDAPVSACDLAEEEQVSFTVKNEGIRTINAGEELIFWYDFQGGVFAKDTFELEDPVAEGASFSFAFDEGLDLNQFGTYNIRVYQHSEDEFEFYRPSLLNDSAEVNITMFRPDLNLPDTLATFLPDTVILDVEDIQIDTYMWNDDPSIDSARFHVVTAGTYWVEATGNSCTNNDTVVVHQLKRDIGLDTVLLTSNYCEFTDNEQIKIGVYNFEKDTIRTDFKLIWGYQYENEEMFVDTIFVPRQINPNDTIIINTGHSIDLSQEDYEYSFMAFARLLLYDFEPDNDSSEYVYVNYGPADFEFAQDTIVWKGLAYSIDAGEGYSSYTWNDNSEDQYLEVNESGSYHVLVSDEKGCVKKDTVYVFLKIRDIQVAEIMNLTNVCATDFTYYPKIKVFNTGSDTIQVADTIVFGYQINESNIENDTVYVSAPIYPGDFETHVYYTGIKRPAGDYYFDFINYSPGDIISSNDTLEASSVAYDIPEVDLGADVETTEEDYELSTTESYTTYSWSTGDNTATTVVSTNGNYSVSVEDEHGCTGSGNINVFFTNFIPEITAVSVVQDFCEEAVNEEVSITVKNTGTKVMPSNQNVKVSYNIDGGSNETDQIDLQSDLNPGASIDYTFTQNFNLSETGGYVLNLSAYDYYNEARSTSENLNVHANPDFAFDTDTIKTKLPYVIDPGYSAYGYEWNTGATTPTLEVSESGEYWLEVTSEFNCETRDYIYISEITGVEELDLSGMILYPNPFEGKIKLENTSNLKIEEIEIINLNGSVIYRNNFESRIKHFEIDASDFEVGVYFIRIRTKDKIYVGQLIKQ